MRADFAYLPFLAFCSRFCSTIMLNYHTLETLRSHHPAWRLLNSPHAPLIASFLQRVFVMPNVRVIAALDLAEMLEDDLYVLREQLGEQAFPKRALEYLNDWAGNDKGWLRKFYLAGSDEAQFDLSPASEKAIAWLSSLQERSFVGTESRLLTLFDLLKQMQQGSETDPEKRIAELQRKRDEIDAEMTRVLSGDVALLDDTAVKDRFLQFNQLARELLTDFREVEHNFRLLDRRVRERIALWDGSKGALLEEILKESDAIADSDQGKSFRAFWDFLMSSRRQEELGSLLDYVLDLAPVIALKPEARTRRIHYDWLEAGEHTQRTVAQLSQQLRRFLDDKAWLENRRIMDILHSIESKALALRQAAPSGNFTEMPELAADITLPMERPLYTPSLKSVIRQCVIAMGDESLDASVLYAHIIVDKAQLAHNIRHALQLEAQVSLQQIIQNTPLQHGLAELIVYLQLASDAFSTVINEEQRDCIRWQAVGKDGEIVEKSAELPRVIFVR
jgi:hypothetical protein